LDVQIGAQERVAGSDAPEPLCGNEEGHVRSAHQTSLADPADRRQIVGADRLLARDAPRPKAGSEVRRDPCDWSIAFVSRSTSISDNHRPKCLRVLLGDVSARYAARASLMAPNHHGNHRLREFSNPASTSVDMTPRTTVTPVAWVPLLCMSSAC